MAITTYAELKTAVGDFLNRDDLTSVIPDFITLAEAQVQRKLRHWQMEKSDTLSVSSRYTALPSDWLQPIRVTLDGKYRDLRALSLNEMSRQRYLDDDTGGEPQYYAVTAGQLELWPTPDATYTANLIYYRTLPVLSDSNTTNWLLDEAPDVYLYGALTQSAPYLADDARVAVWGALFAGAVSEMQDSSDAAKWGGGSLRLRA